MKVLVTGVAGFIGSFVARNLLTRGDRVIGVDEVNDYYDVRIKESRLDTLRDKDLFSFYQCDIRDKDSLQKILSENECDAIINLAARAGVRHSLVDPHVYLQTNAQGTLNLLECMREFDIQKLVLASTSSLYAGQPLPFDENMPVNLPISSYAASKKSAELMAHAYHHLFEFDVSILRYFTVYGPAGRPDMCIFRFIRWIDEGVPIEIFGDGSQSRDFTYVSDVADGTVRALKPVGYEIINIGGGGEPVSLLEVLKMLEGMLGKAAKMRFEPMHVADISETKASIKKAKNMLGWEPSVTLEEGLRNCVDWYLANRDWVNKTQLP